MFTHRGYKLACSDRPRGTSLQLFGAGGRGKAQGMEGKKSRPLLLFILLGVNQQPLANKSERGGSLLGDRGMGNGQIHREILDLTWGGGGGGGWGGWGLGVGVRAMSSGPTSKLWIRIRELGIRTVASRGKIESLLF